MAKACEPPAGIARLAGVLRDSRVPCRVLDANLEGQLHLITRPGQATDTWTYRAEKNCQSNLAALRATATCLAPDRLARIIRDLNRLLTSAGGNANTLLSLTDYHEQGRSPLRSDSLLAAAAFPKQNPFYHWFSRRLPDLLDGVQTVGLSLNYLSQALCCFAMVGFIRHHFPDKTIVLGGGLVTSWLQRPDWTNPFHGLVDRLVAGPGEDVIVELSGVVRQDSSARPDYAKMPLTDYLAPGLILPFSAASGCYWNRCSFCPERAEGNRYRPNPVSQTLQDLQELCAAFHPRLIHLLDNTVSPALLRGLVKQPPGAPWYGFARIDRHLADLQFCRELRQSGCVMLKLGLESGDQKVLDILQKGIDLEMTAKVLANLKHAGIAVYAYLLFGTPAEDEAAARRTLEFVARQNDNIDFLNIAVFNMPASSADTQRYPTEPFYAGDLSLYVNFQHPLNWNRRNVRSFLQREFYRHPAVAPILRRDPPFFSSNLAPMLVMANRVRYGEYAC